MKITSKCLLVCASLLVCFSLQAQLKIGVKGGAQISNIYNFTNSDTPVREYAPQTSLHGGAWTSLGKREHFSVKLELLFSERKVFVYDLIGIFQNYEMRLRYLSLPIIGQFQFKHTGIELGIQLNNLGISERRTLPPKPKTWKRGGSVGSQAELGGVLGLNYSIHKLTFGTRCYYSITPTGSQKYSNRLDQRIYSTDRTGVLQFYIAYALIGHYEK